MRLVTVGTGTVVPDPDRGSACYWLEGAGTRVLIDCGAGSLQGLARTGLPWGEVEHLAISHFHADHIGEIPSFIFALRHGLAVPRAQRLDVWGPIGTKRLFTAWADALGAWLIEPGFPLSFHEIDVGTPVLIGELNVLAASTPHTSESVAFRFEAGGRRLGYTGDTGPDAGLAEFFSAVDLLLAECSLPDELVGDNHLSPNRLARLAVDAQVDRLAVTHVYPQLQSLDVPGMIRAAGFAGAVIMAEDGLEITV